MQSGSGRLRRLFRFRELVFVPPTAHGPKALLHERDELLPRPLRLPHVHVVICEVSVRLEEEREPDTVGGDAAERAQKACGGTVSAASGTKKKEAVDGRRCKCGDVAGGV